MILVDSNVPMYLVGVAHPNREAARRALEEAVTAGETLCTDAEVLQERIRLHVEQGAGALPGAWPVTATGHSDDAATIRAAGPSSSALNT